jgi:hypothetical protein
MTASCGLFTKPQSALVFIDIDSRKFLRFHRSVNSRLRKFNGPIQTETTYVNNAIQTYVCDMEGKKNLLTHCAIFILSESDVRKFFPVETSILVSNCSITRVYNLKYMIQNAINRLIVFIILKVQA